MSAASSVSATASEPRSASVHVNGFDLHYWEWSGSGRTLVCLHPSGHYGRIWESVAQHLAPDFHVVAPDQRGHGDSGQPPSGNAAEDNAADVEALAAARDFKRIVLVGHSLGARTAMVHAAQHPDRVSHLILVGGPHFSTLEPGADVQHWQNQSNTMRQRARQFATPDDARTVLRASYPQFEAAAVEHALRFNTRPAAGGGFEWKFDPSWVADGLTHALDDLSEYAAQIRCPILILRATRSWEMTPERMPRVVGAFRGAARVTVGDVEATANLEVEAPRAVASAIRTFLST